MKKKLLSVLAAAALGCSLFSAVPFVSQAADTTGVTMYRLYNPNSGEHFYTKDASEKDNLVKAGWSDEGIGWIAPEKSNTPVYRLYNENAGDHHYTMNASERDGLITAGWKDEGTGWYSDDDKTVPLYREYNPNAVTGTHNYTTDKAEHDGLVKAGWKDEGIGWYGIPEKKIDPLFPDAKIGDIVTFGSYEQDNDLTNGAEPIEWQYVADRDGHKLLLSKYALDGRAYHDIIEGITWENCTLRKWLNNDFYNTAFSDSDKEKIVTAYNENPDSTELYSSSESWGEYYGGQGGNATNDKVFLLNWKEAKEYFAGQLDDDNTWIEETGEDFDHENYNLNLLCSPTIYAQENGVRTYALTESVNTCYWWLRSPGAYDPFPHRFDHNTHATRVEIDGELDSWPVNGTGSNTTNYETGVRPAILID